MYTFILVIITSLFFEGILNRTRSKFSGRQGPGILQTFRDQRRLLKKGSVYSTTTTYIFQLAPTVNFAVILLGMLMVPFGKHAALISFQGDFVFFTYALALARFLMMAAALDTGSPFNGMGANREGIYGLLVEPALFIILGSFALLTDHISFAGIYANIHFGDPISYLLALLAAAILFQVLMAESGRVPIDDPRTHLELTMIHEVIILDHSGVDMALITYGNSLKFGLYGALIANFFLPASLPFVVAIGIFLGIQVLLAMAIGWAESFRARNPMRNNPQYLVLLTALSFLVFFTATILAHRFNS
jgi:formate hydrogenlyase subunit 4